MVRDVVAMQRSTTETTIVPGDGYEVERPTFLLLEELVLGRYRIKGLLGQGGLGIVYFAVDEHMDRSVALKTLNPNKVVTARRLDNFRREALALGRLEHPSVVKLYTASLETDPACLVMEVIQGRTLSRVIREKQLPRLVGLCLQVALALEYAHSQGVVHRDLKPANIMVTPDGRAVLLDFGLAQLHGRPTLPRKGEVVGTHGFMPPEQLLGRSRRWRPSVDVFGLGVVLYCSLTGRMPFEGRSRTELLRSMRGRPVPPTSLVPGIPSRLDALCLDCLQPSSRERPSAAQLAVALGELVVELESHESAEEPSAQNQAARDRGATS